MKLILHLLATLVIVATVIPFSRKPQWWIRGFDFPRLQFAIVGGFTLVACLLAGLSTPADYLFAVTLAIAVSIQAHHILPFTSLRRPQVQATAETDPDAGFCIVIANVLMSNRCASDLLEIIEQVDPDIVLTLESDQWWQQELEPLHAKYRWRVACPQDNLYGMHLFSKLELVNPQTRFDVEDGVPSIHATVRLRSGHDFHLHCVHPAPPSPSENAESTERDGELLMLGQQIAESGGSTVVTGDLNDVAWSETTLLFRKLSGLLDPRIGRGMYNSFHAGHWYLRWPLDHLFHSSDFTLSKFIRLDHFGSDHFPICVQLQHSPAQARQQAEPKADDAEFKRAKQKIREVSERTTAPKLDAPGSIGLLAQRYFGAAIAHVNRKARRL